MRLRQRGGDRRAARADRAHAARKAGARRRRGTESVGLSDVSNGESIPLDGKIVIVTGAAGGIGKATTELIRSRCGTVIATDISPTAETHLDVSDDESWGELTRDLPRIDGLVNAAGVTHRARLSE